MRNLLQYVFLSFNEERRDMSEILGEFLGTMVLIMFGVGVVASISLNKALAKGTNWLMVAFGWGFAVMFGIYTAGFFAAPGHLNPAVTISFALGGLISWSIVPGYIIAQIAGAFCGAAITTCHFYPHFKETTVEEGNSVGIYATGPAIPNKPFNLISEIVATFAFILCLLTLGEFTEGLKPLIVALLVAAIGCSFGSTTGYAINPARDFGPRLAYAILPIPNKGTANWSYAWIPFVGPTIGATIAVLLINIIG